MNLVRLLILGLLIQGVAGCASNGDPRDPLEPLNRGVRGFNEGLDKVLLKPVAKGYSAVVPDPVRTGVRNVFSNVDDVTVVANDVLQFKFEQGTRDFLRFVFNTTFGLFGALDVSSEMGLSKHNEDFGQTLGYWGVPDGAYLVLPILGPSSVRDGIGLAVEFSYTDLVTTQPNIAARNEESALRLVSRRAGLLEIKDAVDNAALDPYEFERDFYLERRRALVYDGKPPKEE